MTQTLDSQKAAQAIRNRRHYERIRNDPDLWKAERLRMQAYCDSKLRFLAQVKEMLGCIDCGRSDVRLDFDHRRGTTKLFTLGCPRVSWKRLLVELDKCDIRCASCHSRRHGLERGGLNGGYTNRKSDRTPS